MAGRKNYIITIGIDEYKHPQLDSFTCCVNDCQSLVNVLSNDYGFETIKKSYSSENPLGENRELVLYDTDATYKKINEMFENLMYHPEFEPTRDAMEHNLIIYFSGHGLIASEKDGSWFYWVPNDYKGDLKEPKGPLFSMALNLTGHLARIRYHNLLIISDSCNSAGVLHQSSFFSTGTKHSEDSEDRHSVWALCSSASDQLSKAGTVASLFTSHLIAELEDNVDKELEIMALYRRVEARLQGFDQQAFHERLNIIPNNTGYFSLTATAGKVERILSKKIEQQLQSGVEAEFNYIKEKEMIDDLDDPRSHICAIISGTPEHAPHLLLKILLNNEFLTYDRTAPVIDPVNALSESGMENILLNIFRLVGLEAGSVDELVRVLNTTLNATHFLVKIAFSEDMIDRFELIQEMDKLMKKVQEMGPVAYKLIVMIIDDEDTKYQTGGAFGKTFRYFFMDEIGAVTDKSFQKWYTNQKTRYGEEELKLFLDVRVKAKIKEILGEGDQLPAAVVRKICTYAGCDPLAKKILTIQ